MSPRGTAPEAGPKATASGVDAGNPSTAMQSGVAMVWDAQDRPAMTLTAWYRSRYHLAVAMNLRLPPDLADALRDLAVETGRSQQDLVREAVAEYVRDYRVRAYPKAVRHLITPAHAPDNGAPSWEDIDGGRLLDDLLRERREARR